MYPGSDKTISGRGMTNGDSPDLGSLSSDNDHEKSHAVEALWENRGARTWPSSDSIHASAVSLQPQGLRLLYRWSLVEGGCRQCWALGSIPSVPLCSLPPASGLRGGALALLHAGHAFAPPDSNRIGIVRSPIRGLKTSCLHVLVVLLLL